MSPEGQNVMRRLDVVTVKGSEVPIGIYTYDALQDQVLLLMLLLGLRLPRYCSIKKCLSAPMFNAIT